MIGLRPKFMDSPYFVPEFNNWHLLPGAPEEVVKEFEEFKKIFLLLKLKKYRKVSSNKKHV